MGSIRNVDWAAASNVGVQVFQQVYRNQFRIFNESPGFPRIKNYALIESSSCLCTLSNLPKLTLLRLGGTYQTGFIHFLGQISVSKAKYSLCHQGNEGQGI